MINVMKYKADRVDNGMEVSGWLCIWQGAVLIFDSPFNLTHHPVEVDPETLRPMDSEKEQVEDIGETLANAIKEMPEGHKLKCYAVRREEIAVMDVQVIPDDQEFMPFGRETKPPDPVAKQTTIVNPDEWDAGIIDCAFSDQDCICSRAATEGMSVMYCRHCGLDDVLCLDKCPLEDGPVEVRLK